MRTAPGKSTLMSVLFGLYQPERARIKVRGREVKIKGRWTPMPLESVWCTSTSSWYTIYCSPEHCCWEWRQSVTALLKMDNARKKVVELSERYGLYIDPDSPGFRT